MGYSSANYDQLLLKLGYTQGTYSGSDNIKFSTPYSDNTNDQRAYTFNFLKDLISDQYFGGADVSSVSPAVMYYIYHTNFVLGCEATRIGLFSEKTSLQASIWSENSQGTKKTGSGGYAYTIWDLDDNNIPQLYMYEGQKDSGDNVKIGPAGITANDTDKEENCSEVAEWMQGASGQSNAEAYAQAIGDGSAIPLPGDPGDGGSVADDMQNSCEGTIPVFGWLVCNILEAADSIIGFAESSLTKLLRVDPGAYGEGSASGVNQIKTAWSSIRIIASILVVGVALFMVISQILGLDVFSAYTVKKILPKLVVAVILIQLSWFIFTSFIQIGNILGDALQELLFAPFGGPDQVGSISAIIGQFQAKHEAASAAWEGVVAVGGTIGVFALVIALMSGAAIAMGLAIGGIAISVILAILVLLFVLVVRLSLIIALLVICPLALVAWILPNTQSLWNKWWSTFSMLVLMYALIVGLLSVGKIIAYLVASSDLFTDGSSAMNFLAYLIIIITYFGQLFFVPKTYSYAGKTFASIAGGISKVSGKVGGATVPAGWTSKKPVLTGLSVRNLRISQKQGCGWTLF